MPAGSNSDSRYALTGERAHALKAEFGTPLYVIDEAHLRARIRRWREAFEASWLGGEITFASKANSTLAVLQIAHEEGCLIDAASQGELRAAMAAGVPARRCHLHGNNKTVAEIEFAIQSGIGQIVVDSFEEIQLLTEILGPVPDLIIRLAPGVDPVTHAKISTGQADTKFGFNIANGAAEEAVKRMLEAGLPLKGFHCHVGSQLLDPEAQVSGGEIIAQFAVDMLHRHGLRSECLNVGGGLGIRYTDEDEPMAVEEYCQQVAEAVKKTLEGTDLHPLLVQEPGRSIIGESGVTLYEIGNVKTVPSKAKGQRTYLAVDGGLSDNPRPVMYGSKYTVRAFRDGEPKEYTISGKHCETDKLFEDVMLPADLHRGDLIQVLCTGAYNSSMANNYNRYPRPATVVIRENGEFALVQRRDSWDEMIARESLLENI
jgi:diaminopimelate decarboxylase